MQCLYQRGRGEPLPLSGARQIELQALCLRLHAEGVAFEGNTDADGLIELLFVVLGDAECLAHDLHKRPGADKIEILPRGGQAGVSLLRRRARIGRRHQLVSLQGSEDRIAHRNLCRQIGAGRIVVLRDVE